MLTPGLTPAKIQELADPMEEIYIHIVDELMVNIGKHLRSPTWTHTANWEIQKLSEMGQLTAENAAIINKWIKEIPAAQRDAMEETRRLALEKIEAEMQKAEKAGWKPPPLSDMTTDNLREIWEQATEKLNLVNTTMLQSSLDQYRKAVNMTQMELMEQMVWKDNTQKILNDAATSVTVGAETRNVALRRAISRISEEGLTGFYDRAGHKWSPEAYVNMDIRTTVHNTAIQAVKDRMADWNTQVFQVSSHAGARPLCYPYQGKFYSWDNTAGEVELGDGSMVHYEPLNKTSYGQPAGLFGINCGHFPIPIVPGVTIPHGADNIQPKEANDKAYQESQVQRSLEREIRAAKREVEMAGDLASPEMRKRVRDAQAEMRAFIERTGRTRRYDREQIGGTPKPRQTSEKETETQKEAPRPSYNAQTVSAQIEATPAMNEYTYWSEEQAAKRFEAIKAQTGFSDEKAREVLTAFSGDISDYRDIYTTPEGWFYRADTRIRKLDGEKWSDAAKAIDEYIEAAPKYAGPIYRGLSLDRTKIEAMEVGGIFQDNGSLSSWTSGLDVAQMFAEGRTEEYGLSPVIIETRDHPRAAPVAHLSMFGEEENEVLVSNQHGNQYTIDSVENRDGIVYVKVSFRGK